MTFDVVITTFNRAKMVNDFAENILRSTILPEKLIVVDSSDSENGFLSRNPSVSYIRSSIKSQPYQRYLGLQLVNEDYVIFFDDDLKILDHKIFEYFLKGFQVDPAIVGVSVNSIIENSRNEGIERKEPSNWRKFFYSLAGYKFPKPGEITFCGFTGGMPKQDSYVKFFYGDNMCFKRDIALRLFDESLFRLFEKREAMGEDKLISLRASKYGKLYRKKELSLHHPENESTYKCSQLDFIKKTTFSRFLISKQYCSTENIWIMRAYIHFLWHFSCLLIASIIKNDITRSKGILSGMIQAILYSENTCRKEKDYSKILKIDLSHFNSTK